MRRYEEEEEEDEEYKDDGGEKEKDVTVGKTIMTDLKAYVCIYVYLSQRSVCICRCKLLACVYMHMPLSMYAI